MVSRHKILRCNWQWCIIALPTSNSPQLHPHPQLQSCKPCDSTNSYLMTNICQSNINKTSSGAFVSVLWTLVSSQSAGTAHIMLKAPTSTPISHSHYHGSNGPASLLTMNLKRDASQSTKTYPPGYTDLGVLKVIYTDWADTSKFHNNGFQVGVYQII